MELYKKVLGMDPTVFPKILTGFCYRTEKIIKHMPGEEEYLYLISIKLK